MIFVQIFKFHYQYIGFAVSIAPYHLLDSVTLLTLSIGNYKILISNVWLLNYIILKRKEAFQISSSGRKDIWKT